MNACRNGQHGRGRRLLLTAKIPVTTYQILNAPERRVGPRFRVHKEGRNDESRKTGWLVFSSIVNQCLLVSLIASLCRMKDTCIDAQMLRCHHTAMTRLQVCGSLWQGRWPIGYPVRSQTTSLKCLVRLERVPLQPKRMSRPVDRADNFGPLSTRCLSRCDARSDCGQR